MTGLLPGVLALFKFPRWPVEGIGIPARFPTLIGNTQGYVPDRPLLGLVTGFRAGKAGDFRIRKLIHLCANRILDAKFPTKKNHPA